MNKISISTAVGVVAGLAVLASSPVQATEGYFSNGYGAVNKSMAGAGVATGFDAMSQATNPAALTL
ncbi:MAG: hydrocarbon degradation protein, partial [Alphaproteobacteria bacterium]|nr:hydrocarbon degradation protein [Alphaproteobacteria bacterium]